MQNTKDELLRYADLLYEINEQVVLRDNFVTGEPGDFALNNVYGNTTADGGGGDLSRYRQELQDLSNNIHRMDYFSFRRRLDQIVSQIKQADDQTMEEPPLY
ncbi:MAG: hypothetical protein ACOX18_09345 [Bacillota bacterium]|jgi:hypothetical protein